MTMPASTLPPRSTPDRAATGSAGSTRPWLRALELTAPIPRNPERILPVVIEELAERRGHAPALLSDRERFGYRALVERARRYARWALAHELAAGETVALLMPNRPEYMAIWLGITAVGGAVSLLNTRLAGPALAHAINLVAPRHVIVAAELAQAFERARPDVAVAPAIWAHEASVPGAVGRIDDDVARRAGDALRVSERRPVTITDRALYIYTSGTTGMPKAACISHGRLMQWSHWFAGLMDVRPVDRMYNCLPMCHSVGGVLATGAALVGGGSVVIREAFSARAFWEDVTRWDCTLFQYIGELCRYLAAAEPTPAEMAHRIRLACGNGLAADVWQPFARRFRIPRLLEFYAATEGNVSLFNVDGKPGAIGRVPPFLAHRFGTTLVRLDPDGEEPARTADSFCVRCNPGEVGEAIGRIPAGTPSVTAGFEGYTDPAATQQKILRDVFEPGDAWFRTGDLMRRDADGYFYFVDRIGDTFRWKGENVATAEVAAALTAFEGVTAAAVYGVTLPGADGRAGMATIVADTGLDLDRLRTHLVDRLPDYARPRFLRLADELDMTATFKPVKRELQRQGYDPGASRDPIYVDDPARQAYVRLDADLHARIQRGDIRVR